MAPAAQPAFAANWTRRAERAQALQDLYPAAAELLRFYARVLEFQGHLAAQMLQRAKPDLSFRDQLDFRIAIEQLPELLRIAEHHGPSALRGNAVDLRREGERAWRELLANDPISAIDDFFFRASLQPLAEHLQSHYPESTDQSTRVCPVCGSLPQLIILRPEGEGARRSLLCSFCLREWQFRRVLCPHCGELDKEKLPYFTADECKHVRVEACDTCRRYLKSIDLSLDGLAVPLVDEVALSALDLWAIEHDYRKLTPNLLGL